jgi:predicted aspartyl protease
MSSKLPLEIIRIEEDGCHIFTKGRINGKKVRLLIDTGASRTVFDKERIIELFEGEEVQFTKMEKLSTGLGTNSMESETVRLKELKLGRIKLKGYIAVVLDMMHVNQSYQMLKLPKIDGVIGGDILSSLQAVIDYKKAELIVTK